MRSPGQGLAARAVRRRTPADEDANERRPATLARLSPAPVGLELILHRAVGAIGEGVVTEGRPLALDRLAQDAADRPVQARKLLAVEPAGDPERMQPAQPECLVDVDVAKAGDRALVEERRLERRPPPLEPLAEAGRGERAERLAA